MKLLLKRVKFYSDCTIGELYLDGKFECYTLEDVVRTGSKVYGETAIPIGTYALTLELSPRLKRITPRLHNVPQFEGVLIHSGNTAKDTEGCILVGRKVNGHTIEESKLAYQALFPKLEQSKESMSLTLVGTP